MRTSSTLSVFALASLLAACSGETTQQAGTDNTAANAAAVAPAATVASIATDRAGLVKLVDDYLAALVAHDISALPLADSLQFVENAQALQPGAGLWQSATGAAGNFKLYVPDPVAGQVGFIGLIEDAGAPALLGLRLQVDKGRIVAAEHLVARNLQESQLANLQQPRAGLLAEIPADQRKSRAELLAAGYRYYDAVDLNDGSLAPFADDCVRRENGWQTSSIPPRNSDDPLSVLGELGCAVQLDTGAMAYIDVIDNRRVFIADPETGLVFGLSHFRHSMQQKTFPLTGVEGVSERPMDSDAFDLPAAHIFKIGADGNMHEIEAMGFMLPYDSATGWGW